jgi:hypothetical protein
MSVLILIIASIRMCWLAGAQYTLSYKRTYMLGALFYAHKRDSLAQ